MNKIREQKFKKRFSLCVATCHMPQHEQRAIREASQSTAVGPDGLTVAHLKHLGVSGRAFLTELFNLSVGGIDLPSIWKCSTILPILKTGKPRTEGASYRPISLLCPAVKILEHLLLPFLTEALDTRVSQHGFKPRHSCVSALLPLVSRITEGFNMKKPPGRTVAVVVDISKAFDSVSHVRLLEMIHQSRLQHNVVRWLTMYLRGRLSACLYRGHRAPYRHVHAGVPQGSVISPALFNPFMSDCPLSDYDMASYADDFTIMASSPKVDEAVVKANRLMTTLVEWAQGKELSIAPHKSSVTLFTPDTHQSHLHPKVKIGDYVIPLNRTPKILGVTWDTHLTFAAHARDITARSASSLRISKALAGTNWGFDKETLVHTYKAITRPVLNYGAPIWIPLAAPSTLAKLEVIQNAALRLASGNVLMAPISHLHSETKVLPLSMHLKVCGEQFYASALQTVHPSHECVTRPSGDCLMKHSLRSRFSEDIRRILGQSIGRRPAPMFGGILRAGSYGVAKTRLKTDAVHATLRAAPPNKVLLGPPPEVDPAERMLPRPYRSTLSQLRSGYCSRLQSYLHRVGRAPSPACPDCGSAPHTTEHLFSCPESPTDLVPADLWTAPLQAAQFISSLPAFSDLPPFPVIPGGPFPPPTPLPNLRRSRAPRPHTHTHNMPRGTKM